VARLSLSSHSSVEPSPFCTCWRQRSLAAGRRPPRIFPDCQTCESLRGQVKESLQLLIAVSLDWPPTILSPAGICPAVPILHMLPCRHVKTVRYAKGGGTFVLVEAGVRREINTLFGKSRRRAF
jgi:hypothetical protein